MRCRVCEEDKSLDAMVKNRNRPEGHEAVCKSCHAARQGRYYAEDPDRIRERIYKRRDPALHVQTNVKWAQANTERVREYKRKWAEANPEAGRDKTRRRRARRLGAFVEDVRFEDILIRDVGTCGVCGQPIMDNLIELDHVIPLAAGGTHEPNNVQIAHRSCNRRKATKIAA